MYILVYGNKGWIGGMFTDYLDSINVKWTSGLKRAEDENICDELTDNITHVISLIGRTHGIINGKEYTTIDYLQNNETLNENLNDNLYGPLNLYLACQKKNKHFTYIGTGCIFNGYDKIYTEKSVPDFFGSNYSIVKGKLDMIFKQCENMLNLRIRMPISRFKNKRNFIDKILSYDKICSMNNSMTILDDFIPIFYDMMKNNIVGTYNCTNPSYINHNEILTMIKEYLPEIKWENMTLDEQDKVLLGKRSNNILDTTKIQQLYPNLKNIKESIKDILYKRYN